MEIIALLLPALLKILESLCENRENAERALRSERGGKISWLGRLRWMRQVRNDSGMSRREWRERGRAEALAGMEQIAEEWRAGGTDDDLEDILDQAFVLDD